MCVLDVKVQKPCMCIGFFAMEKTSPFFPYVKLRHFFASAEKIKLTPQQRRKTNGNWVIIRMRSVSH